MATAPATPDQLAPSARPAYAGAATVTVTYYRADVLITTPMAGGWSGQDHVQCEHLHTTREAADACAVTLARREQRKARAAFTPCECHGATPSRWCAEHPEPIVYYVADSA